MRTRARKTAGLLVALGVLGWLFLAPANRAAASIYRGDSNYLEQRYAEAYVDYRLAESYHPGDWRPALRQAMALQKMARNPEASTAYQRALSCAPSEPEVLLRFSVFAIQVGSLDLAKKLLQRQLSQEPGNFEALRLLARLSTVKGDYRQADRFLSKVVEINPYFVVVHWEMATLRVQFDAKLAIESCRLALRGGAFPQRPAAMLLLAQLYRQEGQPQDARAVVEALAITYPGSQEAEQAKTLLEQP